MDLSDENRQNIQVLHYLIHFKSLSYFQAMVYAVITKLKYDESYNFSNPVCCLIL